jgi:hypothetical protein
MSVRNHFHCALAALSLIFTQPAFADVQHFVAFHYKPGVDPAIKADIARRFIELKDRAMRDGRPYIVSIVGGKAASREGFDRNLEEGFIVRFRTASDRDYFVGPPYLSAMDPSHEAVAKIVTPLLDADSSGKPTGLFVFDFDDSGR